MATGEWSTDLKIVQMQLILVSGVQLEARKYLSVSSGLYKSTAGLRTHPGTSGAQIFSSKRERGGGVSERDGRGGDIWPANANGKFFPS